MKLKPAERLIEQARQKRQAVERLQEIITRTRAELEALLTADDGTDFERELRMVRLDQATGAITDTDAARQIAELQAKQRAADARRAKDADSIKAKTDLLADAESRIALHEAEAGALEQQAKQAMIAAVEDEMTAKADEFVRAVQAMSSLYVELHGLDFALSRLGGGSRGGVTTHDRISGFAVGQMRDTLHERGTLLAFCGVDHDGAITQRTEAILQPIAQRLPEVFR